MTTVRRLPRPVLEARQLPGAASGMGHLYSLRESDREEAHAVYVLALGEPCALAEVIEIETDHGSNLCTVESEPEMAAPERDNHHYSSALSIES